MRQIASVEIHAIVNELQVLAECYLKKFYDLGDDSFRLLFESKSGSYVVYIKLLQAINLTTITEEVDEPTNFAKAVRKRLLGKKLRAVAQHYSDRIVVFDFSGEDEYKLIVEMFGKGNVVLADKEYRILLAYNIVKQKDRDISPKVIYQFPSSTKINVDSITKEQVEDVVERLKQSPERIIKELSNQLDVGPLYLEDMFNRSLINPKSKGDDLEGGKLLAKNIFEFFENVKNPKPVIYSKDGELVDYAIFPIIKYKDCEVIECESISKALEKFYLEDRTRLDKSEEELDELKANIANQKKILEEITETERHDTLSGHKIMEQMYQVNQIIDYIVQKRRVTAEELREKFGLVKSVDLKNKTMVIEVKDE